MLKRMLLATILLTVGLAPCGGAAAETPRAAETWTAVPLPDGTLMYVRYGPPGGVRIDSRSGRPDSAAFVAGAGGAVAPVVSTVRVDSQAANLARVRQVLREELARLRGGSTAYRAPLGVTWTGPAAGGGQTLVVEQPPRPGGPLPAGFPAAGFPAAAGDSTFTGSGGPAAPPEEIAPANPAPASPPTPAPTPPPERIVDTRIIREQFLAAGLFRTNLILFATARADLLPVSRDLLATIGRVLRGFPGVRLRVEGHTDPRGSSAYNLELSRRRADAVRAFLVTEAGLSSDQIEARGYGEDQPIATGRGATDLALNRRVEFRILNPETLKRVEPE